MLAFTIAGARLSGRDYLYTHLRRSSPLRGRRRADNGRGWDRHNDLWHVLSLLIATSFFTFSSGIISFSSNLPSLKKKKFLLFTVEGRSFVGNRFNYLIDCRVEAFCSRETHCDRVRCEPCHVLAFKTVPAADYIAFRFRSTKLPLLLFISLLLTSLVRSSFVGRPTLIRANESHPKRQQHKCFYMTYMSHRILISFCAAQNSADVHWSLMFSFCFFCRFFAKPSRSLFDARWFHFNKDQRENIRLRTNSRRGLCAYKTLVHGFLFFLILSFFG